MEGLQKHKELVGVVVRTGRMDKTVTVRIPGRRWVPRIKKVSHSTSQTGGKRCCTIEEIESRW